MTEYSEDIELGETLDISNSETETLKVKDQPKQKEQQGGHSHGGKQCHGHGQQTPDDNQGHQHSHSKQRRSNQIIAPLFYNFMVALHFYYMHQYLELFQSKPFDYWICVVSFYFLTFMTQLCYFRTMFAGTQAGRKLTYQKEVQKMKSLFMIPKPCETCQLIKCARINHCSICNTCQVRMDHHCPWTMTCITQRSHKSFLLYNIYLSISLMQQFYYAYSYYYYLHESGKYEEYGGNYVYSWYAFLFNCSWIFLWVGMLTQFHLCVAMSNVTTLEQMKGAQFKMPCKYQFQMINIYDQGLIANIIYFLDNRQFLFWYPTINYQFDDGFAFPMNQAVSKKHQIDFDSFKNPQIAMMYRLKNQVIDYDQEFEKLKENKKIVLQYQGQLIKL